MHQRNAGSLLPCSSQQSNSGFELWIEPQLWIQIKKCMSNVTSCKASHLQEHCWHTQVECRGEDLTGVRHTHTHTHLMLVMLPVSEPSLHLSSWLATICRSASSSRVRRSNCNSWRERENVLKQSVYLFTATFTVILNVILARLSQTHYWLWNGLGSLWWKNRPDFCQFHSASFSLGRVWCHETVTPNSSLY